MDRTSPSARGYDGTWRRLRAHHLRRHPLCVMCMAVGRVREASVVDHIVPFHGTDDPRRLDPENLQSLCAPCHSGAKQQQDKGGGLRGCDVSGRPLDPTHHWNAATNQGGGAGEKY